MTHATDKRISCSICHVDMPIETLGVHHSLIHPEPFDNQCPATEGADVTSPPPAGHPCPAMVSTDPTPENGDDECD